MAKGSIEEHEKRLCISYLDEVDPFMVSDHIMKAMVSFTAEKESYIKETEREWKKLRENYKIPPGTCLHFRDIKYLLTGKYNKTNNLFYDLFKDSKGDVEYKKLHSFYNDILEIIGKQNFILQATGIKKPKQPKTISPKIKMNSIMYQLFTEHLDRIAFYMIDLTMKEFASKEKELRDKRKFDKLDRLEPNYHFTKLRYDGGYELNERNDYRDAFSHCIADGTKHFSNKITKEVFDNLSFVSKREVGQGKSCTSTCSIEVISHAGAEIVDFAAVYIGRHMFKDFYRDYEINASKKPVSDVEEDIERKCMIKIPGQPIIDPMKILYSKLFENADVAKYKKIEEYPY